MTGTRGVGVQLDRLLALMFRIDTLVPLSEAGVSHTRVMLQLICLKAIS